MVAFEVPLSCVTVRLCELPHPYILPFIKGLRYREGEIKASFRRGNNSSAAETTTDRCIGIHPHSFGDLRMLGAVPVVSISPRSLPEPVKTHLQLSLFAQELESAIDRPYLLSNKLHPPLPLLLSAFSSFPLCSSFLSFPPLPLCALFPLPVSSILYSSRSLPAPLLFPPSSRGSTPILSLCSLNVSGGQFAGGVRALTLRLNWLPPSAMKVKA